MALAPYPWLEDAARTLAEMRVRLPNAVLVYGPPGIGLYELAFAIAQSLLCENPKPDGEACGECSACALMKAGTHPDCRQVLSEFMCAEHEVPYVAAENERPDAKKRLSREIRIHQIRALEDFVGLNASRGGRRVIIVYPADMVRAEAAAALLKSMEEPPKDLIYILAAEDIDAVLPTIRSRSRLLRVPVPPKDVALAFLKSRRVKNPEEALALAGGAPLEALERNPDERLEPKVENAVLGLLEAGSALTAEAILVAAPRDYSVPAFALLLARWTHDLMRVKSGLPPRYFISRAPALSRLAQGVPVDRIIELDKAVAGVRRAASHPLNAKQVWEAALMQCAALLKPVR